MRIQQSLVLLLLVLAFFFVSNEVSAIRTGQWEPIKDLNDPHVQEIGQFAIGEFNKEKKTSLKIDHLVSGESQVVAGLNYKLVMFVSDGPVRKTNYEAVVWEKPAGDKSLISFKEV